MLVEKEKHEKKFVDGVQAVKELLERHLYFSLGD